MPCVACREVVVVRVLSTMIHATDWVWKERDCMPTSSKEACSEVMIDSR